MVARLHLLFSALIIAGCASPGQVVKTFESPDLSGAPFSHILVVGAHEDRAIRRQFEVTLVEALRSRGVDAVSSIEAMPAAGKLDHPTVSAAVKETRADAVLVSRLQDVQWGAQRADGRTTTEARNKDEGNLLDFFRYDYVDYEDPMDVSAVRTVIVSSDLFRVSDQARIWGAESTAVEKHTAMDVIESIAAATTGQLRQDGLIP